MSQKHFLRGSAPDPKALAFALEPAPAHDAERANDRETSESKCSASEFNFEIMVGAQGLEPRTSCV
jgi:hypothetical protein